MARETCPMGWVLLPLPLSPGGQLLCIIYTANHLESSALGHCCGTNKKRKKRKEKKPKLGLPRWRDTKDEIKIL